MIIAQSFHFHHFGLSLGWRFAELQNNLYSRPFLISMWLSSKTAEKAGGGCRCACIRSHSIILFIPIKLSQVPRLSAGDAAFLRRFM